MPSALDGYLTKQARQKLAEDKKGREVACQEMIDAALAETHCGFSVLVEGDGKQFTAQVIVRAKE